MTPRILLTLFFGLIINYSHAQFPQLIEHSRNAFYFVPPGYKILKDAGGDLNGDKLEDIVLILEQKEASMIVNAGNKKQQPDTQYVCYRIMMVAFYNYKTNMYDKVAQCNSLIPRKVNNAESLVNLSVEKQQLSLQFAYGQEAVRSEYTYSYQFLQNEFTLTQARVKRRKEEVITDYQFLFTDKKKIVTIQKPGKKAKAKSSKLNIKPLKTFSTLSQLQQWNVVDDVYL